VAGEHFDDDQTSPLIDLSQLPKVSHYVLVSKIGSGGMGEVYLAEDTNLNRKVALKFLSPHLCQDADCRARFMREAQAAAKLDHPNIVTVYEVGEHQGRPFFAMQHIEGQSLRDYAHAQGLTIPQILEIGIQIAEGLQAAHEKGVTHRDIKPANVLIDSHGRARILDFGLASVAGTDHLTKTGSTLGTIGYMSPEQVRGEQVDHRTDIFSLGVVLYELITGRQPFRGDNDAATSRNITDQEPEPLERYKSGVGAELQRIISKALQKDKTLRYQHVDELGADLGRIGKETQVAPATHRRRWRLIAPSLVVVGLVVLALILKPWRLEISPTNETQAATNWLAVMYFDNVAEPSDSKRLGEIATNLLITGLSQSEYIRVMSSQRLYDLLKQMGKEGVKTIDRATASQIARKAEAKWMLTGTILQSEPTIVLTSQLIDVASGGVVASQRVTGNQGENIFAIIDRLTEDVKKSSVLPAAMRSEPMVQVAAVTTHSQEAYKYYLQGLEYYDKIYFPEAAQSFRKAIELDSTFASAYLWLSQTRPSGEEQGAAISKAEQYADRASDRERRLIQIFVQVRKTADVQAMLNGLQDYLARYPDDKWACWASGWIHWVATRNADSALMFMNRASALDPTYRTPYNYIAYVYGDLGRYDSALATIAKYIQMAPNEANPYDTRGDLYASSGQLELAIESYRKALSIKPDYYVSIEKLGRMYLFAGQFQRAESLYQNNVTAFGKPERGTARGWLVDMGNFEGKFNKALRLADDCITANKLDGMENANAILYIKKGEIFDCLRMYDSAAANARIYEKSFAADTFSFEDFFIRWYYRAGDTARAARLLERLSVRNRSKAPMDPSYWNGKGEIALAQGDYPHAIEYFWRADSLYTSLSTGFRTMYGMGEAYWASGDDSSAIMVLERLLKDYYELLMSSPYIFATAHYLLGRAYETTGNTVKAQSCYEKFLTIWTDPDPGIKEVDDAKARLARLKAKS
jgi:serine/threonine protein kinase/tetratricopeptide (TPR) repeat protein